MHKIGATLLVSASLSACSSDEAQPPSETPQQSWRLVAADWWLLRGPYGMQISTKNRTTLFEYDESDEISHISSVNLEPTIDDSAAPTEMSEENLLSFNSYRFFNTSSSNWDIVEHTLVQATQETRPDSESRFMTLYTFQSWGDTSSLSRLTLGDWGGVNEQLDPNFPEPSDFDTVDSDSDFPNFSAMLPTTQRHYDNGKVSQVLYFDSHDEKPFYRQSINYEKNLLSNIQQARRVDFGNAESIWEKSVTYSYIYPTAATVMVEVTLENAMGEIQSFMASATYEQANCGPMTKERSQKMVPQPFVFCITR